MNLANPVSGLGTFAYTCISSDAGPVTVECKSTIPWAYAGSVQQSSGLQIVINLNGSPVNTATGGTVKNPTSTQGSIGNAASFEVAAGDIISVVLSSANAIDAIPNNVKSTINMFQGIGD